MFDLMIVNFVIALVLGIGLGYLWRERKHVNLGRVTFVAIIALIFLMGFNIGSDNALLTSMPTVGVNALVIVSLTVFFSLVFVKVVRKVVKLE
jgi:uncharacterized membrane protein YadS